ncbi:MAG: DUF962 domain-containing protein [Myxococcales bacterium]|nr:DUF962 domain-containing protein [Myxococcales bacterium]MCB9532786.1 DUF962 domain-containing protein [Myxococcales bacterium]
MLDNYKADHTHPMNRATHMIGIPMIVVSLPLLVVMPPAGIALFVIGWVFQFIGHAFEGNMPSFFRDPRYLLVGPMFFVEKVRGLAGAARPA